MKLGRPILTALGALAALAIDVPAQAHPHIWIEATVEVAIPQDRIDQVRISWTYDDYYSAALIDEFDRDKNRKFDPAEIKRLESEVLAPAIEFHFYAQARVRDRRIWAKAFRDFTAEIKGELVTFRFTLDMPEIKVDPRQEPVALALFDETYYVEIDVPKKRSVTLTGDGAAGCSATIAEDAQTPLFGGAAYPQLVTLSCGAR